MSKLLLATNNPGKVAEFRTLLGDCGWEIVAPRDAGVSLDVAETGRTYRENATMKASAFAEASGLLTLADDSGIEVDALDGRPGIMSARYAGEGNSDAAKVKKLLDELKGVPDSRRTARFRCVIALARPRGDVRHFEGTVEGRIGHEPHGENGFGYDPIFVLPDRGVTVAELNEAGKNEISHRGRAARLAAAYLRTIAGESS